MSISVKSPWTAKLHRANAQKGPGQSCVQDTLASISLPPAPAIIVLPFEETNSSRPPIKPTFLLEKMAGWVELGGLGGG